MKKQAFCAIRTKWSVSPIAAWILCAAAVLSYFAGERAQAADRMVLCEEFTSVWCLGCPFAGTALGNLIDVYPDSFVFVQYHWFDDYRTEWGDDRSPFYGVSDTPTAVFDGISLVEGSVVDVDVQYEAYRTDNFLPRRAAPTDVTIELSAEEVSAQTYRVYATVGIEFGGSSRTLSICMVQVVDYWPAERGYHRNGFKQAAAPQEISLRPGEVVDVDSVFTLDADSWADRENVKIVVWAQDAVDEGPAEIHQAAWRAWPFVSEPDDVDADGHVDASDNCPDVYNPDQADQDHDNVGDRCDNCAEVVNRAQLDEDEDSFGDRCDTCPSLHHLNQDDTDGDGLGDVCDACPEVGPPVEVDSAGRPVGSIDLDCDVDLEDFSILVGCDGGPLATIPPTGCDPGDFNRSDLDGDGDMDLADVSLFATLLTDP